MSNDPFFFGYGSLVNTETHGFARHARARLSGWRRVWRHTALRPVAFLTAEPHADTTITGLVAAVPGADWAALDLRERGYDRVAVTARVHHEVPEGADDIAVYTIPEGRHGAPDAAHPVLQSYLDTVLQGYLAKFGEEGVRDFVATTAGWEVPLLCDRKAPRYPRARSLTEGERRLVDALIEDLPVTRLSG